MFPFPDASHHVSQTCCVQKPVVYEFHAPPPRCHSSYGKLISTAKARSQGFYPEPNNKKVAQAPRTMKNRGYYN